MARISFQGWILFYCAYSTWWSTHTATDGHLDCFLLLAIMDNGTLYTRVKNQESLLSILLGFYPNSYGELCSQCFGIWRWGFWEMIRVKWSHESGAFMIELGVFLGSTRNWPQGRVLVESSPPPQPRPQPLSCIYKKMKLLDHVVFIISLRNHETFSIAATPL
jgi:hypothetical protein